MECLATCEEVGSQTLVAQAKVLLARLYVAMERTQDAIALLEDASPYVMEHGSWAMQAEVGLELAKAYFIVGDVKCKQTLERSKDAAVLAEDLQLSVEIGMVLARFHHVQQNWDARDRIAAECLEWTALLESNRERECIDCGDHTDPPYDMTKSTTANYLTCAEYSRCNSCESNNQCRVSQSYAEGSMWSALMVSELCWVGSLPAADGAADMNVSTMLSKYGVRFPIGCQTRETGLFISQKENGIMGMAQDPNTIVPYLVKSGVLKANMFSLCFADTGGTMVLGGVDTKLHIAPPIGWFTVEVLDILIGNVSLNLPPSWYNSGSTDSYMPSSVGSAFAALYKKMAHGVAYREDDAVLLHPADQRTLPAIQFVLRGMTKGSSVVLSLPPTQYYTTNADGTVANNVHFTQSSGGGT
ncbi:hypothetical protein DYB32_007277 [Aphanomyces invadans]|uniref:Xylanase inhibitor N-terminal domain-containing protein n=1 Tax=Aphanomyces invadans TaxID=157072 RepID=A0A3R7CXT2_9STRA|nr:hypothetical protein DYB32_007277 [Aphanomyces invadans]